MIKSELIQKVAKATPHLYERDISRIVHAILDTITEALSRGDRVEIWGFGVFTVKNRPAHMGRNPRTGIRVPVAETCLPFFKTGGKMHRRLNKVPAPSHKRETKHSA